MVNKFKGSEEVFGTDNEKALLRILQDRLRTASESSLYTDWRTKHISNKKLYLGKPDMWFDHKQDQILSEMGVPPTNANMIAPLVDVLCGVEIEGRFRMKASIDSVDPSAQDLSDALTAYLRKVQIEEEGDKAFAAAFKDCVIGGLGWVGVDYRDKRVVLERVDPMAIVWNYTESKNNAYGSEYVFRYHVMSKRSIIKRFGEKATDLRIMDNLRDVDYADIVLHPGAIIAGADITYSNVIVEYCYLRAEYGYEGKTKDGFAFKTLDESAAKTMESAGAKVEKRLMDVPYRAYVCQGRVLEHERLDVLPPDSPLPYLPISYGNEIRPISFIDKLVKLQQEINYAISVREGLATSSRMIIKTDNELLKNEIRNDPHRYTAMNSVIAIKPQDEVSFYEHTQGLNATSQTIQLYLELMKKASGIEDESRGIPTNATSGVAQEMRERMSMRTNAYMFDSLIDLKKRVGKLVISILQASMDSDILVMLSDRYEKRAFMINWRTTDEQGREVIMNNIFGQRFFVSVEETPIFARGNDAARRGIGEIAKLPDAVAQLILNNEELLGMFVENPRHVLAKINESKLNAGRLNMQLQMEAAQMQQQMQAQTQQEQGMSPGEEAALRANPQMAQGG